METKLSKPIRLAILALLGSAIVLSASGVRAIDSARTLWLWRQPPYEISPGGYTIPSVDVVAWGGADRKLVYAGNVAPAGETDIPQGVYRSRDGGITWDYLGAVDEKESIARLVVHPSRPHVLFAGFNRTYYQGGIYRSEDGGEHWTSVLPYLHVSDIEVDPSNPGVIYVAGWGSGAAPTLEPGVYKSVDEGKTWEHISASPFFDVAVHPTFPNRLFAVRRFTTNPEEGVYRSDDAGVTWTQISDVPQTRILINQNNPDQMIIFGEAYIGIWRTDDGGLHWSNTTANLPRVISDPTVLSALFDPADPNTIWLGLKYDGMYVSHDSGQHWQQASRGLPFLGTGIYGPQCVSGDMANGRLVIACSGRVYVQTELFTERFASAGTYDGWVLETTETGNQGGATNATAAAFLLGDESNNRQYRSILHFDTASLPDNAVVTRAVLKIKKQSLTGTDPFTTHLKIAVDIRQGAFGNNPALQPADFQARASKPAVGVFPNIPRAGGWYFSHLRPTAYPYINRTGITQFRLRFQTDDDNDFLADYIRFYSGNATAANRPLLVIEYYVP